jgi:hypothetical protein
MSACSYPSGGSGGGGSSGFAGGAADTAIGADGTGVPSVTITYTQALATAGKTTVGGTAVSVRGSTVSVPVACNGGPGATCKVTAVLSVTESLKGGHVVAIASRTTKAKTVTVVVGLASTSLATGQHRTMRVSLNGRGRKLLARFHIVKAQLIISQLGSSPKSTVVARRHVRFTANPPTKKKH